MQLQQAEETVEFVIQFSFFFKQRRQVLVILIVKSWRKSGQLRTLSSTRAGQASKRKTISDRVVTYRE